MLTGGCGFGRESGGKTDALQGGLMCPACLAALAMIVAGTGSTGGVAAVLIHAFRAKKGVRKWWELAGASGLKQRRKNHEQASEQENDR
jgi:hypothetical protein